MAKIKKFPKKISVIIDLETRVMETKPKYVSAKSQNALLFREGSREVFLGQELIEGDRYACDRYELRSDYTVVFADGVPKRVLNYLNRRAEEGF